eukprot:CAMPEP_0204585666 /NCGR_PEP_ID=MMETSP0661-20131031/47048_1 /ASSEMBLY_ACC=CAM_ASM_000606 /TAXON_ID=109239 /ORGANISM="Alexandrium margalefi, Strain AMGDE01CS-322" /LENGTH=35 /DNA_ID= /DNA_START= /DNA_END= /DNA_ORIENTATION=
MAVWPVGGLTSMDFSILGHAVQERGTNGSGGELRK